MRPVLKIDPGWWGTRATYLQVNERKLREWSWGALVNRVETDDFGFFAGFEARDRFGNLVARYTKLSRRTNWKEF